MVEKDNAGLGAILKYLQQGIRARDMQHFGITVLKRLHCRRILEMTIGLRKLGSYRLINRYWLYSLLGELNLGRYDPE